MAKNEEGLTWDEASPELRSIVADNQAWAESKGYAPKGSPEHGALRMKENITDPKGERTGWKLDKKSR